MPENERKKLVGVVDAGGESFINLYELDLSNPESLLKFKPKTWPGSDESWVFQAAAFGIEHAWNHDFQAYMNQMISSGAINGWGPKKEDPGGFWRAHFGEKGLEGFGLTNGNFGEMIAYFLETDLSLEKMGAFGKWIKEAGIDTQYAKAVIKEFLED